MQLSSSDFPSFLTKMLFTKTSLDFCLKCLILFLTVSSPSGITFVSGEKTAEEYKTSLDELGIQEVGVEAVKRIWNPNRLIKVSDWLGHYDASGSFPVESIESQASSPVSANSGGMIYQYPGENDRGQNDSANQISLQEKEHQSIPEATSSSMFPVDVFSPSSLTSSTDTPTDLFGDSSLVEEGEEGAEKSDSLPKEFLSQSFFDIGSPSTSLHADQSNIHDMTSSFHVIPAVSSSSQRTFQDRQKVMQDRSLMYKQFRESSPDMSSKDQGISTSESVTTLNSGSGHMDLSERSDDLNRQVESVHFNNTIPVVYDTAAQNRAKTDYLTHSPLAKHDAFDSTIHSYSYLYGQGPDRSDGRLHAFETTHEYHFPTKEIGKSMTPESATSGTASTPFLITRYVTPPSAGQSSSSSRVSSSRASSPVEDSGSNKHKEQAELRQLRHRYQKKSILSSLPSYMFSSSLFYPSTSHHRRSLHYDQHNRPQYRVYLAPNDYHYSSSGYSGKKRIPVSLPRTRPSLKSLYSFPPPSRFLSTSDDIQPQRGYSSKHSRSSTTNPKASKARDHASVATLNIYSYRGEDPSAHPSHNYEFDLKETGRGQGTIDLCVGHECNHREKQSLPIYYPKSMFREELASTSHPTEILPEMSEDVTDTLNDPKEFLSSKELFGYKPVYRSSDVIGSIVGSNDHPWYTSIVD